MNAWREDFRYGARLLLKNRVFTAVSVLTLALGIGANSAIFSIVNALVLKPLPFEHVDRLVAVRETLPNQGLAMAGFLLLLACANVANLLFARATGRRQEMAIRSALGAGRWKIVRQLTVESLLLASLAGLAGLMLALWSVDLIRASLPADIARHIPGWRLITVDGSVLAALPATRR